MAKFIKSAVFPQDFYTDKRQQFGFIGRSNVGKSSLINAIGNNSKLAFTSKTPGHTKVINYFDFDKFILVDLPGYGYAKTSNDKKSQIYEIIINYLNYGHNINTIFVLCDINVITEDDLLICDFLKKEKINFFVILTKNDKVNKSFFHNNKHKYLNYLKIEESQLMDISSKNKTNIDKLLNLIKSLSN